MDTNTSKKQSFSLQKYAPSRKVQLFMLGTSIILILILLAVNAHQKNQDTSNPLKVTVSEAIQKDSDNDGVPDWEEKLYGTDSNNPDSDSDGIPDATEIANKKEQIALQYGYGTSTYTTNNTDAFARDLFVTYTALSGGGALPSSAADKLGAAAAEGAVAKIPNLPTHSAADFKVVPNTGANNDTYKKTIVTLTQKNSGFGTEFAIINQGVMQNDGDLLRDAEKYAKNYTLYSTALMKVAVPENQIQNHVRLVNDVTYIGAVLPYMDSLDNDIVKGLPLYTIYTKAYQDMFSAFEAIGKTQ